MFVVDMGLNCSFLQNKCLTLWGKDGCVWLNRLNKKETYCNENIIKEPLKTLTVKFLSILIIWVYNTFLWDLWSNGQNWPPYKNPKCHLGRIIETWVHLKKGIEGGGKEIQRARPSCNRNRYHPNLSESQSETLEDFLRVLRQWTMRFKVGNRYSLWEKMPRKVKVLQRFLLWTLISQESSKAVIPFSQFFKDNFTFICKLSCDSSQKPEEIWG